MEESDLREPTAQKLSEITQSLARLAGWHYNTTTGKFTVGEEMAQLLGLPAGTEPAYDDVFAFVDDGDTRMFKLRWHESLAFREPLQFQGKIARADGSICFVDIFAEVQIDSLGEVEALTGVLQDVTHRVGALHALQRSEAQLRIIYEGSSHGILLLGLDTTIVQTNQAFAQMIGYTGAQLLGRRFNSFLTPDDEPDFVAALEALVEEQLTPRFELEARCVGHKARILWVNLTVSLVRGKDDRPHRLIAIVEDVSRRHALAAELSTVRRQLAHSRDRAQQFLAQELHDGPVQDLHAARFQLQALRPYVTSDAGRTMLERTQDLFQNAIDTLRTVMGQLRPPALTPFGVAAAIRSHAEQFHALYPNIELHLDLSDDGQRLPEELRLALFRVTQELMTNVAKHANARHIWLSLVLDDRRVKLLVKDDGDGFTVPLRLMEFARDGHLGLLGISERVDEVGGEMVLQSSPGRGTTVTIYVTIQDAI